MNTENKLTNLKKEVGTYQKISRKELAVLLGKHENYVSAYLSGKQTLPNQSIMLLSEKWGIRPEYLRDEDNYRTEDDLASAVCKDSNLIFNACLSYLESIGYAFSVTVESSISKYDYLSHAELIRSKLKKKCIDRLDAQRERRNNSKAFYGVELAASEKNELRNQRVEHLEWKVIPDKINIDLNSYNNQMILGDGSAAYDTIYLGSDQSTLGCDIEYHVSLLVKYNGKSCGQISISKLQFFTMQLKNISASLVQNILLDQFDDIDRPLLYNTP